MNIFHQHRAQPANTGLNRFFKTGRLMGCLGGLLLLGGLGATVQAGQGVILGWDKCTDSVVARYNVYSSGTSDNSTNLVSVGVSPFTNFRSNEPKGSGCFFEVSFKF